MGRQDIRPPDPKERGEKMSVLNIDWLCERSAEVTAEVLQDVYMMGVEGEGRRDVVLSVLEGKVSMLRHEMSDLEADLITLCALNRIHDILE